MRGRNTLDHDYPVLRTTRLLVRPFAADEFSVLAALAGERCIADTMISVPHPYSPGDAQDDIARYHPEWVSGTAVNFAIALPENSQRLIGYIGIKHIDREHEEAELSFWIDESAAGRGYITEAARAVPNYAFDELKLNRICAYHMVRNPSSGRVLEKIGMKQEGRLRQRVRKWGCLRMCLFGQSFVTTMRRAVALTSEKKFEFERESSFCGLLAAPNLIQYP